MLSFLFKLEWLKYRRNSVFILAMSLYALLLPLLALASKSAFAGTPGLNAGNVMSFPIIWNYIGYVGNWLSFFFFGFFGIYIFTSEFLQRTYRQNIIYGVSRVQLYAGKIFFLCSIALVATVYYILVCIIIGSIYSSPEMLSEIFARAATIPRYLLMNLGYMTMGVIFALLINRTAVAVFLYFSYILFFEVVMRWFVHRQFTENITMNLYPANAFEDLMPMPLSDWSMTAEFFQGNENIGFLSPSVAVIASICYLVIFLAWGRYQMNTRDL